MPLSKYAVYSFLICSFWVFSSCQVKHGPTFAFAIKGRAVAPSLEFSFTKYNFGKCFLYCPGMVPASQTLVISNKGARDVRYLCLTVCFSSLCVYCIKKCFYSTQNVRGLRD